jgi:peroxiredoxin
MSKKQITIDDQEKVLAPEFTLPDLNGQSISLSDFRGEKHIVLVFNRGFM